MYRILDSCTALMEVICSNDIELHLVCKEVEIAICYFSKISFRDSHSKSSFSNQFCVKKTLLGTR